jgi:hypothetical protein
MLERISWLMLACAIHLPPFAALFVPSLLTRLYSVQPDDPNFVLLRHRAALFGVVVIACLWAAFDEDVRKLAFVATALSMVGFLVLYVAHGRPEALTSIAVGDLVGLPFLAYVGWKAFTS